ncbi:hypothetical protein C5E45_03830 [Nocardia nova]|uniref:Transposase IS204/IS1001/IS1096/IS1165 DDE domain-containing protein n=1 Tax=Nocardia nova TaxID=37330 RepID=A0A2S6AVU1_9NOCA|nr:hypothetical protein [Nocardia nova]PPJ33517.1 hypothetical protein C5E41_02750 [Nocardia nova]PPJ39308.1 hypothetical protein C5E45_03830 [Nocardia nova]
MIDLGTRRPVDLIDGRDGDALAAWLRARPLPQIICRDRVGGARQGAPDALQVADRFHLGRILGRSSRAIGRELGLHPATARKFAGAATVDPLVAKNQQRSTVLDGYHEHLHRRWNDGIRNAAQPTREIAEMGYPGTEQQVQRYLRRYRASTSQIAIPAPWPPSVRKHFDRGAARRRWWDRAVASRR